MSTQTVRASVGEMMLAIAEVFDQAERLGDSADRPEGVRFIQISDSLARSTADHLRALSTAADTNATRVRAAVGRALGIADDVQLSDEQLVVAIERLAASSAQLPGMSLLARDL